MPNLNISQQSPNIVIIKISRLSYLAFIEIFTKFDILSYELLPTSGFYTDDAIKYDVEYATIMQTLTNLADDLKTDEVAPFGRIFKAEIAVSKYALAEFANKLTNSLVNELQTLGRELCQLAHIMPTSVNITQSASGDFEPINKTDFKLTVLDKDNAFENKLIFYYLFQNQKNPIEKIAEKAEMMTPEQKENIFDQIFHDQPPISLPKSIQRQSFCALEIIAPFFEMRNLIKCPQTKILIQNLTVAFGAATPDYIIKSNKYEIYLSTMEIVKKYFNETNNQYIIPLTFKQRALTSVDLHLLSILKHSETLLGEKIISEINKNFSFLNTTCI